MNPTATQRTASQAAASRVNGARSAGPVTALGKVASSANGIIHGFSAHGALMAGETPAMYEANLATWFESLHPATAAEAKLVARLADTDFRQGRLARAEERLVASTLESLTRESLAQKVHDGAAEVLAAVHGLVALAESVPPSVDADAVRRLMPAMEVVAEQAAMLELPVGVTIGLTKALEDLVVDSFIEVTADGFVAVAKAARAVEAAIVERLGVLKANLDQERERLTELVLFGDGDDARRLDRHRARLGRELEQHARALKAVRELAAGSSGGGSGSPVTWLVELRVVGRVEPR
jgi:hypothetical protein